MFQKSILTFVTLLLVSTIHGQTTTPRQPLMASVDPSFFQGLRYRLVGPARARSAEKFKHNVRQWRINGPSECTGGEASD